MCGRTEEVQTFLPFADFRQSAAVLDAARLGKQRVEALQVLRAIVLPSYGWQSHPAMQMWRGYVPALTRYALDMVDAWTDLGHADSTRLLITEFAPAAAIPGASLAMPSWMGNDALHLSHRSNLVRKDPEFYSPVFPGVPDDLPYVWPGPDPVVPEGAVGMMGEGASPMWILRPRNASEFDEWMLAGAVSMGEQSPRGTRGPKWEAHLEAFAALQPGTVVAVLTVEGNDLVRGTVTGSIQASEEDGGDLILRLPIEFQGELSRSDFSYPALLQDPRTVFAI